MEKFILVGETKISNNFYERKDCKRFKYPILKCIGVYRNSLEFSLYNHHCTFSFLLKADLSL